jgi:hypothetical protein
LYAVGRRALATDTAGVFLHPEAVDEVETRYDTLLSSVTRLHREISNLNKRASVRPAPEGTVAELAKATCANSLKWLFQARRTPRLLRGVWPRTMYNDHAL